VRPRRPVVILLAALLVAACSGGPGSASAGSVTGASTELMVYAAASLKAVLAQIKTAYEAATPGITLTIATDSSTALETKIEQGAPADVLLSADTKNPQALVDKGFASGSVVDFAGNLLTVIVPSANPAGIGAPADLAKGGVKVIACSDGVPIQTYTAKWLAKVSGLPAYGADFAARYDANVVTREDNVGSIVAKVALGEGDAGVVYVTDAKASGKVRTIDIPTDQNVPATYGGVVVRSSAHADAAGAFLAWLTGAKGEAILGSFGFVSPSR
jgi:molybdate transport system substrate-binding protein